LLLLAIDPGPQKCGYAIVILDGPTPRFARGGLAEVERVISPEFYQGIDRLVIEEVGLVHRLEAAHALVQTSRVEGKIEAIAGTVLPVGHIQKIQAVDWRRAFVGKRNAKDTVIKAAVKRNVICLPTRFNKHVADALGLACVAAKRIRMRLAA
jgi:Holliday junction resolvasome RuvABC endonuclease subunit